MFEMVVEIDEEKVLREQKYDLEEIKRLIKEACDRARFKQSAPNRYYLEDQYSELGKMLFIKHDFRNNECIMSNLSKWITYSDEDGEIDQLHKKPFVFHSLEEINKRGGWVELG